MNWTTEQWSLFWEAFGAIGGTVGALATAAAVIVALWQTKFSVRKKLKLSFDANTVVLTPQNNKVRFVSLTVVNIGNRDVVIQKWGFKVGKKNYVVFAELSQIGKMVTPKLPYTLSIENSTTLCYELAFLMKALSDDLSENKIRNTDKICFYLTDGTGKEYRISTKRIVRDFLKQEKQKPETDNGTN